MPLRRRATGQSVGRWRDYRLSWPRLPSFGGFGQVLEIINADRRQLCRVISEPVEEPRWSPEGNMGSVVAYREKEGLFLSGFEPLNSPGRDLSVTKLLVRNVEWTPVKGFAIRFVRVSIGGHAVEGECPSFP